LALFLYIWYLLLNSFFNVPIGESSSKKARKCDALEMKLVRCGRVLLKKCMREALERQYFKYCIAKRARNTYSEGRRTRWQRNAGSVRHANVLIYVSFVCASRVSNSVHFSHALYALLHISPLSVPP